MRPRSVGRWLSAAAFAAATLVFAQRTVLPAAQTGAGANTESQRRRDDLITALDDLATPRLEARHAAVLALSTRAEADARRSVVRRTILDLLGPLPDRPGRMHTRTFGIVTTGGVRLEKIAFESVPGLWVTANVYVPPSGAGPFPAVVDTPGHYTVGKEEEWNWGVNFARHGIVALVYDPIGQGERAQYLDASGRRSRFDNAMAEHGETGVAPTLLGDTLARYMVTDAMRAVDYLSARRDVDRSRIGAFGCSGGGTMTAYLAALDQRIRAAASACYVTSLEALLPSAAGAQDTEQSLPRFISSGLDIADWIELAAPIPYAIVSTEDDMFPFAGTRTAYEEARHVYDLYGATDRLRWITGPGAHGNIGPIANDILTFFTSALNAAPEATPFMPGDPPSPSVTTVTPTGQVATSLRGETVASLTRLEAREHATRPATVHSTADVARLRARLAGDIRELAGISKLPAPRPPAVRTIAAVDRGPYRLETVAFAGACGLDVRAFLAVPIATGPKPSALVMDTRDDGDLVAAGGPLDTLARAGIVAMALGARPTTSGTEFIESSDLGPFYLLSRRALLVGRTLIGLRVDDALAAVSVLAAREDANGTIDVRGAGPHGLVALDAAVLDDRISSLTLENTLASYRMIVEEPAHRGAPEIEIPGVLTRYDTGDLLIATSPRPVTVVSPRDAAGAPIAVSAFRSAVAAAFAADRALGTPGRITVTTSPR